ncbi:hypothetical protein [Clostridium botulinum]|uniref:hypothetical protein n=1 Tax=Clostridium botulinum TaxID=1491 RepID=UPI001E586B73|nr:hypothetical protein [Clostridium botulinum]
MASTEIQAENMCDNMINKLQEQLNYYNASSVNCPWIRQNDKYIYGDSTTRGNMQDIHKEVMGIWKVTKKNLKTR